MRKRNKMHTKRIAAGYGKGHKWVVTPNPGAHGKTQSIPLLLLVRDILGYADNTREARKIITSGMIQVDKKARRDPRYAVGLMDIIDIPKVKRHFRVAPGKNGLLLTEIKDKESKFKLCKIMNKSITSGGGLQLDLHDGGTVRVGSEDNNKDNYKTGDTIVFELPGKKITNLMKFSEGNIGLVVGGRHVSAVHTIDEVSESTATRKSITRFGSLQTLTDYIFVIGKDKPMISM